MMTPNNSHSNDDLNRPTAPESQNLLQRVKQESVRRVQSASSRVRTAYNNWEKCNLNWERLKLLLWKNFVLQKRHKWMTLFEIASPVVFSLLLIMLRALVSVNVKPGIHYSAFDPMQYDMSKSSNITKELQRNNRSVAQTIAYSPDSQLAYDITMSAVYSIAMSNPSLISMGGGMSMPALLKYSGSEQLEREMVKPGMKDKVLVAVDYGDEMINAKEWPKDIKFTLRFPAVMRTPSLEHPLKMSWQTNLLFPFLTEPGPRAPEDKYGGKFPGYYWETFLVLQHAISRELIKKTSGSYTIPNVYLQRFPQNPYLEDKFLLPLEMLFSTIVMLCFSYTAVNTVRVIATEKQLQLKETMMIMGLPSWIHWLAWFIKQYSYLFISIVIMTIFLKIPFKVASNGSKFAVITYTPWSVFLFFMMLYMAATLTFCFMISTFFSNANTASSFMALIWFITHAPFMFTRAIHEQVPAYAKVSLSLMSNSALGYALQMMVASEGSTRGLQWSNLFKPVVYHDTYYPGHVMLILILDTALYMIIAVYVEKISPGSYGVPLPWYYPFTKRYWKGESKVDVDRTLSMLRRRSTRVSIGGVIQEEEPKDRVVGARIKNLTKIYGKKKAVDGLNLNLYENDITVLLGHNGAGKTTTMSMLTGMIPPTSGTASIGGYDIVKETTLARTSLGLCPQHNVLFPDLTAAEHIEFYSRLKHVSKDSIQNEIDYYLNILNLGPKRDVISSKLSGGQQRRLSVGAAMCGSSKVVLLDEPTSGLDPAARRALWDMLMHEKKGRTIILSTHFMDEADMLGDRIAIMSGGNLVCVGSPFFLKKQYGGGYKLIMVKAADCRGRDIRELIQRHVPSAKLNTDIGSELTYILPNESRPNFQQLLQELEQRKAELGVDSYGLSDTTLEEVFMKTGTEEDEEELQEELQEFTRRLSNAADVKRKHSQEFQKVQGLPLILNHIRAMFLKLGYTAARNCRLNLIQLSMPLLNIVLTIYVVRSWKFISKLPSLKLSLSCGFDSAETPIGYSVGEDIQNIWNIKEEYVSEIKATGSAFTVTDLAGRSIEDYYLDYSQKDPLHVRHNVIMGATFNRENLTGWFGNFGFHDSAISLAHIDSAIMRSLSPNTTLSVYNYPLPFSLEDQAILTGTGASLPLQFAINMGECMAFVTAFIVLFVVKERISGSKLLQHSSGVKPWVMWTCAFLWDWLWLMCISVAVVALLAIYGEATLSTPEELGRIMVVFIFFAYATIPVHYLVSFIFNAPATGYAKTCFINLFSGMIPFIITEFLSFPKLGNEKAYDICDAIFSFLPHYSISRALKKLGMTSFAISACDSVCDQLSSNCTRWHVCKNFKLPICCVEDNPYFGWEDPGIMRYLVVMAFVGTASFAGLLLKEYEVFNRVHYYQSGLPKKNDEEEDGDVRAERNLVDAMPPKDYESYSLVCKNLSKTYKHFVAVQRLSFAVRRGECFGLLGINGAGKTTTFKMLTGDERISAGDAWVHGLSIKTQLQQVNKNIGYCPQFDALLDNLTGWETLKIYCLLRGIPMDIGKSFSTKLATSLGLLKHLDKKVFQYSGGNKRKLSTAIALLGDASLIFLDEPTTGMDPASKRHVWRCLTAVVASGRSVVLTSHSMEECEALCTRLTVMAGGRMHCVGPLQHLKNKFAVGYTLTVKCKSGPERDQAVSAVNQHIMQIFTNVKHLETYQGISTYTISDNISWWRVFALMEEAQSKLDIEDYSVTQCSLEQLFMRISRAYAASSV